jgi:pyruvate kinase
MENTINRCRTKIIATIGPGCDDDILLAELLDNGVDIFRFNFSHGDNDEKADQIERIRRLAKQKKKTIGLLADLQGPKIRTGVLKNNELSVVSGQIVTLTSDPTPEQIASVPVTYQRLANDVTPGELIYIDDGSIELKIVEVKGSEVLCRVVTGGIIRNHKGINLPNTNISTSPLTDKDYIDIDFAHANDVDFLALSFVRRSSDVALLKHYLSQKASFMLVIAKIERPEAVENFQDILAEADGIMIARGDLGVEMRPEKVPLIQKELINQCNRSRKPVVTATQMLESMIEKPMPTRAETSDVANAIIDGTDAVMLSGETAVGKYPTQAVAVLSRIALEVEGKILAGENCNQFIRVADKYSTIPEAIGQAACMVSHEINAKAIIAFTQTGSTAALVSKKRPTTSVYAITPFEKVQRQLTLFYGVRSLLVEHTEDTESLVAATEKLLLDQGVLKKGDTVVIILGSPVSSSGMTNLLKVHTLGYC